MGRTARRRRDGTKGGNAYYQPDDEQPTMSVSELTSLSAQRRQSYMIQTLPLIG
jgi:hypothetical protein